MLVIMFSRYPELPVRGSRQEYRLIPPVEFQVIPVIQQICPRIFDGILDHPPGVTQKTRVMVASGKFIEIGYEPNPDNRPDVKIFNDPLVDRKSLFDRIDERQIFGGIQFSALYRFGMELILLIVASNSRPMVSRYHLMDS